ncbi:MAG: PEP-utilizing enzyme [Thermodesulfovibrionales bacterium]|nr:PEP-utilizing enzyme [Thermodesulfovibrionales bacterium]
MKDKSDSFTKSSSQKANILRLQEKLFPKYDYFRKFLEHNKNALGYIADLEQMYYSGKPFSLISVQKKYQELSEAVMAMLFNLDKLSNNKYPLLRDKLDAIDKVISKELTPYVPLKLKEKNIILSLENIYPEMKCIVGSKAANLAAIKNSLGLAVPPGFAITAYASEEFLRQSGLVKPIMSELSKIRSLDSVYSLRKISENLRVMIMNTPIPSVVEEKILEAYEDLERVTHKNVNVAVRSSAIGEDTEASFAGQYVSILNVTKDSLLDAYRTVLASKYSTRAINYRLQYGLTEQDTPMAVLVIAMINSKASGVAYTINPTGEDSSIKISSIWGIGEHLVSGNASPDIFIVDRAEEKIIERKVSSKDQKLVLLESGGVSLIKTAETEMETPSLSDENIFKLREACLLLEEFFQGPQDIEWAIDQNDNLFILQSRPLKIPTQTLSKRFQTPEFPNNPVLLDSGKPASSGIAYGTIFVVKEENDLDHIPDDSILVAKTASPEYARVLGKIKGIITDIGSITSHLSSVAREFEIPFIVDAKNATEILKTGELVTIFADHGIVYKGLVEELVKATKPAKKMIYESPVHQRTRTILNYISPLNLNDPSSPDFSPEGCKTIHDIIRFAHENAIKEMFGLAKNVVNEKVSLKLKTNIPLDLYIIDLGGGLREGTYTDTITPEKVESLPLRAIWKGFSHPGIKWTGGISLDTKKMMTLLVSSASQNLSETLDITSYAIISKDYMNLSARFGYHFATIDTLCGDNSDQNYISLQFAGGAGSFAGRTMRLQFLSNILKNFYFTVNIKGDLLEANLFRYDKKKIQEMLDIVGRLFATSRLLDLAISNQNDVTYLTESFLRGDYDFLSVKKENHPIDFYIHEGFWYKTEVDGKVYCVQDGIKAGFNISSGVAGIMSKIVGHAYLDFLDTIEAYFYFPLAIAKNSEMSEGTITLRVKPVEGNIDRAGGVVFGLKDIGNYFVFRINALENNAILFEYINNKRIARARADKKIESKRWYALKVEIKDNHIKCSVDDELLIEYTADRDLEGYIGLWTKADSVTHFDTLMAETKDRKITYRY